jgi:CubicO group peptidase (beta-lactamase class C family)
VVELHPPKRRWSGTARVVRGEALVDEQSAGTVAGPGSPLCSPQTRFQAGSISKLVLSVVVLALAERQELDVQAPITRWLDDSVPTTWSTITLHQLLSHTSGIGHWGDIPGLPALLSAPPRRDELMSLIFDAPLVAPASSGWRYSGPGFVVAALVVEAVTDRAYGQVATELVLAPAGLTETTSGKFPIGEPGVATGHHAGQPLPVHPAFTDLPGTGDLWTTTKDLIRLNQELRAGRVLDEGTAARLWAPHVTLDDPGDDDGGPIAVTAYGYGTFLGQLKGREARINPGDNPGYQSLLAYLPDEELDVAILGNEDAPSVNDALDQVSLD